MQCRECHAELPQGARRCPQCGRPVLHEKIWNNKRLRALLIGITIVLIAVPLIWNLGQSTGINPTGFSILMLLAAGAAYATPAASTVGALSFANGEWVGVRRAFKAGILGCAAAIICMLGLGLPLVSAVIGL